VNRSTRPGAEDHSPTQPGPAGFGLAGSLSLSTSEPPEDCLLVICELGLTDSPSCDQLISNEAVRPSYLATIYGRLGPAPNPDAGNVLLESRCMVRVNSGAPEL
jgi:hypothetical protein